LAHKLRDAVSPDCKIIFASSTKVDELPELLSKYLADGEAYGAGKREAEHVLHEHKSFRIPNVFGEFGKPNYNSFVATFAHKICNGEEPTILEDAYVRLTHVSDVVKTFKYYIEHGQSLPFRGQGMMVSEVLRTFNRWHDTYSQGGVVPEFSSHFDLKLFNTFRSFILPKNRPFPTVPHSDTRGTLNEVIEFGSRGKVFTSTTNPRFTRGGHYHLHKFERVCVVSGEATIRMRKIGTDEVLEYDVSGTNIKVIDMPTFYTHDITNTGIGEMTAIFWTTTQTGDDFWEKV
jgi:UDP-2-acetamido-2,6-beta-L-arabino-hexul-4-ose reductase